MEKRKKLKRVLKVTFAAAVMLFTHFLYAVLSARGTGAPLMYGGIPSHFIVNIVSFFAVAVVLALFRGDEERAELYEESAQYDEDDYTSDEYETDNTDAREAYPELFSGRGEDTEESPYCSSYQAALFAAVESQKAVSLPEGGEEEGPVTADQWAEELKGYLRSDTDTLPAADSLGDIPLELPEDYVPYEETEEGDETEEADEEERCGWEENVKKRTLLRIFVSAALTALPILLAVLLSGTKTLYFADGVTVKTAFFEREYSWEDCESYEIAPSFFGDRLSFKLIMNDGKEIQLLPSDLNKNESLFEKYESEYDYALAVSAALDRAGAKKEVKEKNTLAGGLALREDMGDYVKRLCDIE